MDPNAQVPQPGQQPQPVVPPQPQPVAPQPVQQAPVAPQPMQQPNYMGQPTYPQQPMQPMAGQPMMTPPSPGGSKQNFVLIGVIVGVLVLGVLGFFLARGAGSSPQEKAVLNFVKAAKAKDCEGLIDVMSNDYLRGADRADVIEACKENIDSSSMFEAAEDVDIVSTKLESSTDDTATVIVKSKQDGKTVDEEFDLVLEDGKWRIGDID